MSSTTSCPALRIDVDGTVTALPDAAYETIRDGVGGWIEAAPTDGTITVWVNENGKLDRLPFNPLGHALWAHVDTFGCIADGDWMAGPCVVTGPLDDAGEPTNVPAWVIVALIDLAVTATFDTVTVSNSELEGDLWAP
jgi:hypothetical protein